MTRNSSLTAENKRLRKLNSQLKQQQIEAIAVLQSLIPTQNQKWDKQYKDRLYYDLQEAIKILLEDNNGNEMDNNFLEMAKAIVAEINDAWAFPEQNVELSKLGTIGYMSEVGCPHQWWEANCKAYARASGNLTRDRDLNNVCRLAQAMLSEND